MKPKIKESNANLTCDNNKEVKDETNSQDANYNACSLSVAIIHITNNSKRYYCLYYV